MSIVAEISTVKAVLESRDLSIRFGSDASPVDAVRHVSIGVEPGEVLGIVGESGSGKSTLAQAVMGFCPLGARAVSGEALFEGRPLLQLPLARLRAIWGNSIAMVHQNALSTLTPTMSVGVQIAETIKQHRNISWKEARSEALEALRKVNIPSPRELYGRYPHQLSGGQRQRVSIAIALSLRPKVLILDEPTTALDVTTEAVVLDLLRDLRAETGVSMIYISHNLAVVRQIADRIAVMYAGEIVETGAAVALLREPRHPYTRALIQCLPDAHSDKRKNALRTIPGDFPSLRNAGQGCVFRSRCVRRSEICENSPEWSSPQGTSQVRCFHPLEATGGEEIPRFPATSISPADDVSLVVRSISKSFGNPGSLSTAKSVAVNSADLQLKKAEIVGLVGESGSGKTTFLRCIAGLTAYNGGQVTIAGVEVSSAISRRTAAARKQMQMVFQDPASTLNPALTVGENLVRHIRSLTGAPAGEAKQQAVNAIQKVKLNRSYFDRYPRELSGGEKQRVAIARAFVTGPSIVLCDEPLSALDVSVQSNVVQLLLDLQTESQASYVIVSHDLSIIRYISDRIVVMYLGTIVEEGSRDSFDHRPLHPYTEALLSAIPSLDALSVDRIRLNVQPSEKDKETKGCVFTPRCPRSVSGLCDRVYPPWQETVGRRYLCHHAPEILATWQSMPVQSLESQPSEFAHGSEAH